MKKIVIAFFAGTILISCGRNSEKKQVEPIDTQSLSEQARDASSEVVAAHPGEAVYQKYCLQCHQADGSGVPGMHPPLWPNKWINEDKEKMAEIILNGMSGEIEVDGEIYNNLMPPHNHLTDLELANVISYVRSSFGNNLDPVTQKEVAAIRQKLKNK